MNYIILLLSLILIFYLIKTKKSKLVPIVILVFFCINYKSNDNKLESFSNYAPINYSIGPYSNLVLKPKGCSLWRHDPSNLDLKNKKDLFVYQGNQIPLKQKLSYQNDTSSNENAPNVDGTSDSPKSLFMFSFNKCSPECCPSTYSCDHGCICTNEKQRHFINSRGTPRLKSRDGNSI